jgi:hypothetical protein
MVRISSASHFFEHRNEPWPHNIREFCVTVEKISASQPSFCFGLLVIGFFHSLVKLFGYFISWAAVRLECCLVN